MSVTFGQKFPRNSKGAPLVRPVDGGDLVEYVRASQFGAPLDDHFFLDQWKQRITAKGAVSDLELMGRLLTTPADATKVLNLLAKQAFKTGGGTVAADYGTEFHAWMEKLVRRECVMEHIPDEYRANCEAAWAAMVDAGFELDDCITEPNVINDRLSAAGSPDLAPLHVPSGRRIVIDYKTGTDPHKLGYAVQLHVYATGCLYDTTTETRTPFDVDTTTAIIAHVRNGKCRLIAVDLEQIAPIADLCAAIYAARELDGWHTKFSSDLLSTAASAAADVPEPSASAGNPSPVPAEAPSRGEQLAAVPDRIPDDGDQLDADSFNHLRAIQSTLNETQKTWLRDRVNESMHAKVSIHTSAGHTARTLAAIETLLACAAQIGTATVDDVEQALRNAIAEIVDADWPKFLHVTVGHALGVLHHHEVELLAKTMQVLDDNGWQILAAA